MTGKDVLIVVVLTLVIVLPAACYMSHKKPKEASKPSEEVMVSPEAPPTADEPPRSPEARFNADAPSPAPAPKKRRPKKGPENREEYVHVTLHESIVWHNPDLYLKPTDLVIAVDASVTNDSTEKILRINTSYFTIRDSQGRDYRARISGPDPRFPARDLKDGATARGWMAFIVLRDAPQRELVFELPGAGGFEKRMPIELGASDPFPHTITGECVGVIDGNTITVLHDKHTTRVRLHGVDCPEPHQAFGREAKKLLSDMVMKRTVTVEFTGADPTGRAVGVVTTEDGANPSHELIGAGLARWNREHAPGDETLERLQKEAQEAKAGLWAESQPPGP